MLRHSSARSLVLLLAAASVPAFAAPDRWRIAPDAGIASDAALFGGTDSYKDHLEMGGRAVDAIVEWGVSPEGAPTFDRIVRFPTLRQRNDNTHGSFKHTFRSADEPSPTLDGRPLPPQKFSGVAIREGVAVTTRSGPLEIRRTVFPSAATAALLERWEIVNRGDKAVVVGIPRYAKDVVSGAKEGKWAGHLLRTEWLGAGEFTLAPGETLRAGLAFSGREAAVGARPADAAPFPDIEAEYAARHALADRLDATMTLATPDAALNRMFAMAKLRTIEAVNVTRGGLMQGPGGRNSYLAAMWCNDNAEYMAPYHPFLGDAAGIESSRNTYAWYAKFMNPEFKPLPSSIVAEGRGTWAGAGDRGDAAMVAQGASRFALASGDRELAREVWPLIEWCLEYCERKKTAEGVIASDRDELEGRFSAGKTNLATSSLTYDALVSAGGLARELGLPPERVKTYEKRAADLRVAIGRYFGADLQGFRTYRYHEGLENLRAWICLPVAFGILDRAPGTLDALYSPALWTDDGLKTDATAKTFWDRSTLFALRATFVAGDTERGLKYLNAYTHRRLLGTHVPYAIEAYPEQGMSQLSGESCLYARIFLEGLFGLRPTGLGKFAMTPRLPAAWPSMKLSRVRLGGVTADVEVSRASGGIRLLVKDTAGRTLYDAVKPAGETHALGTVR